MQHESERGRERECVCVYGGGATRKRVYGGDAIRESELELNVGRNGR